tara:strand:- start:1644 stop:2000 length:357 start_codon:yes stop_codon:yes gene_type:complete
MNELIEAAKAVIARWDSTDWKAAPTAEVMNRLRAALSAKPEPLPEVEEQTPTDIYIAKLTAAHAAERAAIEHERSGVEGAMYARILALEAELAEKDTEMARLKGLLTIYFRAQQEKTR